MKLALERTIQSFTKFHDFAIASGGLSSDMALALSRVALEIMHHSSEARSAHITEEQQGNSTEISDSIEHICSERHQNQDNVDKLDNRVERYATVQASAASIRVSGGRQDLDTIITPTRSPISTSWPINSSLTMQPSTALFPWTYSHQPQTFTQTLRHACFERGLQLLSATDMSFDKIHPALSIHLKWMTVEELRALTEEHLRGLQQPILYGPNPSSPLIHPDLYRTVEGSDSMLVNRIPGEAAERLIYGRTRTVIETTLPGFEGEWLEPDDVQEYLEGKGIRIRSAELNNEPSVAISMASLPSLGIGTVDTSPSTDARNTRPILSPWMISHNRLDNQIQSSADTGTSLAVMTGYSSSLNLPSIQGDQVPGIGIYADVTPNRQRAVNEGAVTNFNLTLNIQQLVENLTLNAICIGPVPGIRRLDVDKAVELSIIEL